MRLRNIGIALLLIPYLALAGCSSNNTTAPTSGTMRIQMTDAPGAYDAVNLVIREVAVHLAGSSPDSMMSGWQVLNADAATYDLMKLQNGVFTMIGESVIPAGHYTQIRLMLGAGSNIVVDGVAYPLTVPSGMQTGLKIIGEFDVPAGGLMDVALDFDAAHSIHQTGSGRYMLKPVCKGMPFSTAGAISGTVLPAGTAASVYAIVAPDTLGAAQTAADGTFKVCVLPAGSYTLAVHPAAGYRDTSLAGITVSAGSTTSVGSIQLTPQ
jgi:hypothetical protein